MLRRHFSVLIVLVMFVVGAPAWAQTTPPPRLFYAMPPGGQAGSTFDVLFTGQDLNDAQGLHFNFPGVKVERLEPEKAPPSDPKTKKPPPPVGALSQKF